MKRAPEGGDASRGPPKRASRVPREGKFTFKVLCPEPLVAGVLGDGGAVIRRIQENSGGHLTFSQRGDFFPGTRLRLLLVSAVEAEALVHALDMVLELATVCGDEERQVLEGAGSLGHDQGELVDAIGDYRLRCCISTSAGNAIGGAECEALQFLQEETGARVAVDAEQLEGHQLATIEGTRPQLLAALEKLSELVQADIEEPWFQQWAEHRCFGPSCSLSNVAEADAAPAHEDFGVPSPRLNRPPPPPRREQPGRGGGKRGADAGCTIFVGGLTQSVDAEVLCSHFGVYGEILEADVRKDPRSGRSKGFGFVTFSEPAMVERCFTNLDDHVIDGKWADVKRYGDSPDGASDRPAPTNNVGDHHSREGRRKGSGKEEHHGGRGQNAGGPEPGDCGRKGSSADAPAPRSRAAGKGQDTHHRPSRDGGDRKGDEGPSRDILWFADIAESVPREYRELDYCITCKMPEHACGALIGRRGGNIANIKEKTGAKVTVSRKDESQDGHREMTIIGGLCSVYAAHMLLMRTYNENENEMQAQAKAASGEEPPQQHQQQAIEQLQRQIDELKNQVPKMHDTRRK